MRWRLLVLLVPLGCDEAPAIPPAPVRIEAPVATAPAEPLPAEPPTPAGMRPDGGMLWDHRPRATHPQIIQVIKGNSDKGQ